MQFYFPSINSAQADLFEESYFPEKILVDFDQKQASVIPKIDRICRFCNRKYPLVTFRNEAHIIPEQLGNKHLVSESECDDCNFKFGKYDDQLSKFMGIGRTIVSVRGKKGIPIFKSADQKLRAESLFFYDSQAIAISSLNDFDSPIDFDFATGKGTITTKKQSYRPLAAFKSFLKMALSSMEDAEIPFYKNAINYINSDKFDNNIKGASRLLVYKAPAVRGWERPFAVLFRKRKSEMNLPTHIFVLFAHNSLFQIIVPFNLLDLRIFDGRTLEVPRCPPLFTDKTFAATVTIFEADFDLSSNDIVKGEEEIICFQIDPEDLKKLIVFNGNTNEFDYSPDLPKLIKKIVLVEQGLTLEKTDLVQHSKPI